MMEQLVHAGSMLECVGRGWDVSLQIGALNKFSEGVCVPHEEIRLNCCLIVGVASPPDAVLKVANMAWRVGHDETGQRDGF